MLCPGLSRTLFMENRSRYATSIDLPSSYRIPVSQLAQSIGYAGEFAVAVRGDQTFSLRLTAASHREGQHSGDMALQRAITSALVTGGSKVRGGGEWHGFGTLRLSRIPKMLHQISL